MKTAKLTKLGLLTAIALILSLVENMLPPLVPILPYAKLGLSNVVLLFALVAFGAGEGYIILLIKCLFSSVFSANFSILLWSLPSSFIAYSAMVALKYLKVFSTVGISAAGAMFHNAVQIIVAALIIGNTVFVYLPYMLLAGGLAGVFTGLCCHFLANAFLKEHAD